MAPVPEGLWHEYTQSRSPEMRRQLVMQYLELVRYVAGRFAPHLKGHPQGLEQGDIMQFGIIGLMEAIERFSPIQGVKFETFAAPRIRGAILDELRQLDWVPRSVRSAARRADKVAQQVAQENGRDALDTEIAGKLAMTVQDYHDLVRDRDAKIVSHREMPGQLPEAEGMDGVADEDPDPLEQLASDQAREILIDAIEELPERDRMVVTLYYYEGLKFVEIGRVLQVTESRISQIHSGVLRQLRLQLAHLA